MLGFDSHFYYGTTKKVIVAVGSIFDNIRYTNGHGDEIRVPLFFSQREKFLDNRTQNPDIESTQYDMVMPAIGFELQGMNYDPERTTNPMHKWQDRHATGQTLMFNRVAYNLQFGVYIIARRLEESLKIVEQILPFFTPEITLTYKDKENFNNDTNLTITLDSVSSDIDYEGSYDQKRSVLWTLQLTARAYFYTQEHTSDIIKKALIDYKDADFDKHLARYSLEVIPRSAGPSDPHTIKETIDDRTE